MMWRSDCLGMLAAVCLLSLSLPADEPASDARSANQKQDSLIEALRELQREVEQLRSEVRGVRPSPLEARPAAPAPAVLSARVVQPADKKVSPPTSDHWSFQPIHPFAAPAIENEDWARDDIDRFILARLEKAGVSPNPDADRYTIIRRLAFDLTGLPPTPAEIQTIVDDTSSLDDALARAADRYLESDRFGERWGRHWLDVVRYADSVGRNWNAPFTYAWRYRDYVIDALNDDKPYDRFIIEQLAGDLLPASDLPARRSQIIATGFLALGATDIILPEGEQLAMDRIDEQIDVTTRALLGLTVACARCHDHKYEPVTMRDYYALAGVFYSTNTLSGQRRGNYVTDDDLHLLPASDGRTSPIPGVHSMAEIQREHSERGQSGLMISDAFPALAEQADEHCLLNGMQTNNPGHHQAVVALHTGNENFVRPSVGAWATYGLGSEAESLPGFVTIDPIVDKGGAANYGSAFLPATFQGTRLGSASRGVPNIDNQHLAGGDQRKQLDFVQQANRRLLDRDPENPEIEGLIESAELAFRMQSSVPETLDLSRESSATRRLYGLDDPPTERFGTQCLMARRLAESGVRFIQLTSIGWDHHTDMRRTFSFKATSIDRPIAGLIADLQQRDLLRDTLLVWGGEFGRQPNPDNGGGRGHNNKGYTMWMAGGGVRGGLRYGATDDLGGQAVAGKIHTHDLHATILHLLGLDHERLTYHYSGRDFRLTDTAGVVVKDILA